MKSDYTSLLSELGYSPISESHVIAKVLDSIRKSLDYFGNTLGNLLFRYVCSTYGLSEEQLVAKYGLVESSINTLFGESSETIINSIKHNLLEHSKSKSIDDLSVEEMIKRIREAKVLDFLRHRAGHEHILFLYRNQQVKDRIINEFFAPSDVASKGLLSIKPIKIEGVRNVAYDQFLKVANSVELDMNGMFKWITDLHASNVSQRETRFADEDSSWFFTSGFGDECLTAEKAIGRKAQDKMSLLCSYNVRNMADERQIAKLIGYHGYVIIDEPLMLYAALKV